MRVTVQQDSENDQIYIALDASAFRPGAVRLTRRLDEDIALDYDARGKLIGIDIMNASAIVQRGAGERARRE
jgi:uncharacterized protein YuzE